MQHLLLRDIHQAVTPALDELHLFGAQSLALRLLEREGGEQVLAQDQVLELGRLAERVDQRLAMIEQHRAFHVW